MLRKAHLIGRRDLRTRLEILVHRHEWLPRKFEVDIMFFEDEELEHLRGLSYTISVEEVA